MARAPLSAYSITSPVRSCGLKGINPNTIRHENLYVPIT